MKGKTLSENILRARKRRGYVKARPQWYLNEAEYLRNYCRGVHTSAEHYRSMHGALRIKDGFKYVKDWLISRAMVLARMTFKKTL